MVYAKGEEKVQDYLLQQKRGKSLWDLIFQGKVSQSAELFAQ